MTYSFSKTANLRFDDALALVKEALERHDFDVTAEIDVKDIFKKRLNIDFRSYRILAVCNPQLSYRALQAQDKVPMFTCNIVLQQQEGGGVEISAVGPDASVQPITHVVIDQVARQIHSDLQKAIDEVGDATGFAQITLAPPDPRSVSSLILTHPG